MKKHLISLLLVFIAFFAVASTKLNLSNGINVIFEGCSDGSVRFEALGTKPVAPTKEFELKRKASDSEFVQNSDGSYVWKNYKVLPIENGYTLFCAESELYTSIFSEEPKQICERRNWKTATEFYGFGEAGRKVSLRNQSFKIWNISKYGDHAYLFVPFYITNANTCVYYNANSNDQIYFQNNEDTQAYRSDYHRIECFVRKDGSAKESVSKFYKETESLCILPRWAFGFIQSKYGYKSEEEVLSLVDEFKQRNIPLSAVVLDLYWFNKMGDISFTSSNFANPKQLNEKMEEDGVKLITITEPFFTTDSINYETLRKGKMLCKNKKGNIQLWSDWWCVNGSKSGALFNPIAKKSTDFMADKYSKMLQDGIDGFWTDLGEPENVPDNTMIGKYSLTDFHNYYNYYWTKSLYEGMKSTSPDKRLFIMSRSGYTGIGKFNVSVWSGDVSVSWASLKNQIAHGLNASVSGLAYWGSDIGGFTPEKTNPELFVRWYQFGAFTPIFRAHGTGPREPWTFSDAETEIVSKYIKDRTAMLPYVYSTARQTMSGVPMMRPMFYESDSVPQEFIETEYMFGDSILVAPVTKQLASEKEKSVYLSSGNWYEFDSLNKIEAVGGKTISVELSMENIPVYIKEGAIIPAEKNGAEYIFLIPSDGIEKEFVFYNDDGETEQYKNGNYSETKFILNGFNLKAETSGVEDYLTKEFTLVVPSSVKVGTDWNTNGKFMTRTVSLEKLKAGIQF